MIGNIPYDATEEQLVQICEEVGPVVSFRYTHLSNKSEKKMASSTSSPVGKNRKLVDLTLSMILRGDDASFLHEWEDMEDSSMNVLCLSQTVRRADDEETKERSAVLVEAKDRNNASVWETAFARQNFLSSILADKKSLLCAEAFKLLETDFSLCLRSMGSCYPQIIKMLAPWVILKAKMFGVHISGDGGEWYQHVSFSNFASILSDLIDLLSEDPSGEAGESIIPLVTSFFRDVHEEGLKALADLNVDQNQQILDAVNFLQDENNDLKAMKEWAALGEVKLDRNANSHPFSVTVSQKRRNEAYELLEQTLDDTFSSDFRHVGLLSLMKVQASEKSRQDVKKKELSDSIATVELLKESARKITIG